MSADYVPDPDRLRRAAEACRNVQRQGMRTEWFDWVPVYLDWMAVQIDGSSHDLDPSPSEPT